MTTIDVLTDLAHTTAPMQGAIRFFRRYRSMVRQRHARNVLRGTLCNLSDRELQDIGTTRGEIEYVARSRFVDPRGARPA